jgi:molybdopterin-guanine dinucleotide biosynthesis protein A/GNAT superfamily N-acetyltransferase
VAPGGLSGILLVGGASRRFGSPKALAVLDGETLAERAWRLLDAVCDERIAVGKAGDGLDLPFDVVDDRCEVRAPIAGVVAGLRGATNPHCVVVPVDAALLRPEHLQALAETGGDAAVPQTGPLPGVYSRRALPQLERALAAGRLALRDALRGLDVRVVQLDPFALANVNTPADLATAERRYRAVEAAASAARAHGVSVDAPRVLRDWNDTIVHLSPAPVVARVRTSWLDDRGEPTLADEIAVARHALGRGGPVVAPTRVPPSGPHRVGGVVLTFWEFVRELPGDVDGLEAGHALRALHAALADYGRELPPLRARLERAQAVADDAAAVPMLAEDDRRFVADELRELREAFAALELRERTLHGDPHSSNLLRTADGLRWVDLDTVCRGPLEWDLAHLPEAAADAFPEADRDALVLVRRLVSAEVAVWCWRTYGRAPEVDEAARFHLRRLRGGGTGEPRIVPFEHGHGDGFRALVSDTLREFGFEPDPALDPDLADPAAVYDAVWVATEDDAVVGSVALRRLAGRDVELKRMYLRPALRGRGLGRLLLATAIEWSRAHGIERIRLDTTAEMRTARRLYESHGFVRVAGNAPRQGQERLLYELRL